MEQYATVKDYPNYAVSNWGDVLNIKTQRILKREDNGNGYSQVVLSNNGIPKTIKVHRLVALHFIDNPNNYECVDHIDRNRTNNNIDNLRWVDRSQNQRNREVRGHIRKSNTNSWRVFLGIRGKYYRRNFNTLDEATKHLQEKILELDTDI